MGVHSDAHYIKGDNHKYCQDYALSGDFGDLSFAILSDGCSASNYSDVGARALCYQAKKILIPFLSDSELNYLPIDHYKIKEVAREALATLLHMGFEEEEAIMATHATLFVVFFNKKTENFGFVCVGDGSLLIHNHDDHKSVFSFEYPNNTPYYPIYEYMVKRNFLSEKHCRELKNSKKVLSYSVEENGSINPAASKKLDEHSVPIILELLNSVSSINSMVIFSDGISSTQSKSSRAPELVFSDYKVKKGLFVQRAMQFAVKLGRKRDNLTFFDDISSGAVILN